MIVRDAGSIVQFEPEGDFEYEWLVLSVDSEGWQWLGRTLCVDFHSAPELLGACEGAGWVIQVLL